MKKVRQILTQEQVHHLFLYDPETGMFALRKKKSGRKIGSRPGWNDGPYRRIWIDGSWYYEHHLAWIYMTGDWVISGIDHQNRDGLDNRWANLRLATASQQMANRKRNKNNKTGYRGVRLKTDKPRAHPYEARLMVNGKVRNLGFFATAEEAHAAYVKAARESFGVFASSG